LNNITAPSEEEVNAAIKTGFWKNFLVSVKEKLHQWTKTREMTSRSDVSPASSPKLIESTVSSPRTFSFSWGGNKSIAGTPKMAKSPALARVQKRQEDTMKGQHV
jgi:hypothetical protein